MFRWLVALFVIIPALEILVLLLMGRVIGGWQTFFLILLTGFAGAFLAKKEAKKVWQYAGQQFSRGQLPAGSILDGICIFTGGLLLLLPGFLTDAAGFLLIFPVTRPMAKVAVLAILRKQAAKGNIRFFQRW